MKKLLAISLICAAFTSMAQSQLSADELAKSEDFNILTIQWYATERCAIQGQLGAEPAAYGKHLLRERVAQYMSESQFVAIIKAMAVQMRNKPVEVRICNTIAMQIEDARLERSTTAQAAAELEQQQRRDAQERAQLEQTRSREAQLEQQRRRDAQVAAQIESHRQQQEREADAAYKRREMEAMTQQMNQIGQQFRDFGNSVQPRTMNCTRTLLGANCTSY